MDDEQYVIGIDFGTDSVRSVIINALTGKEESTHVSYYKRWAKGLYCNPSENQYRQNPLDHIESLQDSIKSALEKLQKKVGERVIGIGVATTGSTPAPVDKNGVVLSLKDSFIDNPNAMFVLWKDHTAIKEAEEINNLSKNWGGPDFTKYVGGVYSSEWFWAKILHVLRNDKNVREEAYSWIEHADWVPAILTGNLDPLTLKRSRCAAGHKAMWNKEWKGLPSEEFLIKLDPILKNLRDRLYTETYTSDQKAGNLTKAWALKLGLKGEIPVTVGAFDAHMGAVGAEIKEKTFVKILGTSCCDIAVATYNAVSNKLVEGICGQVDGSVIPGMVGLEAGQSSFGDVYAWFKDIISWPLENILTKTKFIDKDTSAKLQKDIIDNIIPHLSEEAKKLSPQDTALIAIDWLNGRRTPYADQKLKGAILGLTLGTDAPRIFRTLVEATAFGAKSIIERFIDEGIEIKDVVGIGGIAQKSPFVMQILSDVLNMPVKVIKSSQAVALGAAMFSTVAADLYSSVQEAQEKMGSGFATTYYPDPKNASIYKKLYKNYKEIGTVLEDYLRK